MYKLEIAINSNTIMCQMRSVVPVVFSGQLAVNEATAELYEEPRPTVSRTDAANRSQSPSRPLTGTSSLQRHRLQEQQQQQQQHQVSSPHHRDARAILDDEQDVFVVGPPGGLFQSTTDPDVSIRIPASAVTQTITLTLQVTRKPSFTTRRK